MNEHLHEVARDEFYDHVMSKDATISTHGDYPYTTHYNLRYGLLIGKVVNSMTDDPSDQYTVITKYYVK